MILAIGVVVGLVPTVFAAPAGAVVTTIACGQTVATDVVLEADVGPCPGKGFEIRNAQDITVDLNGHRVIGPDSLAVGDPRPGIGVYSARRVTLKNGTVTGFPVGIDVVDAAPLITAMIVTGNRGGLTPAAGGTFDHGGVGISLTLAHDTVIRRNVIERNGPSAGVLVSFSEHVLIEQNVIRDNAVRATTSSLNPGVLHQRDAGVWISGSLGLTRPPFDRRGNNTVRNNHVVDNGWHGIYVDGETSGNVVAGNLVARNGYDQTVDPRIIPFGDGIRIAAPATTVERNFVALNGSNGISVLHKQQVVRGNVARTNSQRPGPITTYDLMDENFACNGNVWSANAGGTVNHPCVLA